MTARELTIGEEAEAVRAMRCACNDGLCDELAKTGELTEALEDRWCYDTIQAAHVTARGMGAAKGGRFDLVPLCGRHHREAGEADSFDAVELAKTITDEQLGQWYETPGGKQWSVDAFGCLVELSPVGREAFAIRRCETKRSAFEKRYGLDLRAEADRIAAEHPAPLGIRGLAQRWADEQGGPGIEAVLASEDTEPLDTYETEALFGWVRREMGREVERRWLHTATCGKWATDREGLAHHVMRKLGGELCRDPHGEHGLAWTLCEAAGWPC